MISKLFILVFPFFSINAEECIIQLIESKSRNVVNYGIKKAEREHMIYTLLIIENGKYVLSSEIFESPTHAAKSLESAKKISPKAFIRSPFCYKKTIIPYSLIYDE